MDPCIRVNCSKYHCFTLSMLINIVKHTYYFIGIGGWLDSLPLQLHSECIYYVAPRVEVHIKLLFGIKYLLLLLCYYLKNSDDVRVLAFTAIIKDSIRSISRNAHQTKGPPSYNLYLINWRRYMCDNSLCISQIIRDMVLSCIYYST